MGGASVIVKENQYMRVFRRAGAVDPDRARTLDELGVRETRIFRRMADRGVFVAAGNGAFYMDRDAAAEFVTRRRKRALFMLILVLLALLALFFLNGRIVR
jgi:hypothetical protein